mgnify:FL=1|tara:strand:- start:8803 stop:9522 length:720 start_codon:yes stop_codon:yes gene_type:complete
MARRIKLGFVAHAETNGAKVASKPSKGDNTNNFTQATTSKKPTAKSIGNAHSTISPALASFACDGSNVMSLASTETLAANSTYTIICAWTNGDYTNDTWLVSGTSNDAHWGIKAGGADVIYKADGTKGSAAERDYPINSTANSTTSYTFGSDVEMIAIVVDGTGILEANIYNIDGNKIADVAAVNSNGVSVALPIDHVLGKSDGTLGLNGEILDIAIYNTALPVHIIKGKGNKYKSFKD